MLWTGARLQRQRFIVLQVVVDAGIISGKGLSSTLIAYIMEAEMAGDSSDPVGSLWTIAKTLLGGQRLRNKMRS